MLNKFFETTDDFNFETEKQNFVSNLDMLKSLSVQESTLYKKWQEFNKEFFLFIKVKFSFYIEKII